MNFTISRKVLFIITFPRLTPSVKVIVNLIEGNISSFPLGPTRGVRTNDSIVWKFKDVVVDQRFLNEPMETCYIQRVY